MPNLGLWVVWWLSFPSPVLWEVLPFFFYCLFLWFLCGLGPGCGLFIVCVVLSGRLFRADAPFLCFLGRCCPIFRFFLVAFGFLYCSGLFVGLWPFGNKLLLIKKKKGNQNFKRLGLPPKCTFFNVASSTKLYLNGGCPNIGNG